MIDSLRRLLRFPHRVALVAVAVIAIGYALRLLLLDQQSIWWDEAYSVDLARRGLWEATLLTAGDIHPPLHYWLLAGWLPIAGFSEFALRFQSLWFGVAMLPLGYQLGKTLFGKPAGLVSLAILAVSPFHVAYSQEGRMYTLEALLSVLSVYLMVRLLRAVARDEALLRDGLLYAMVTATALWTDYFPIFVIVTQNLFVFGWIAWWAWRDDFDASASARPYHLARFGSAGGAVAAAGSAGLPSLARRQALRLLPWWFGTNALAAVLYLPWIAIAIGQVTGYGVGRISTPPLGDMLLDFWGAYFGGQVIVPAETIPLLVACLLAALACQVVIVIRKPLPAAWALAYLWGPLLVFLAILAFRPFFNERYIFVATPALALVLGAGIASPLPAVGGRWLKRAPLLLALPIVAVSAIGLTNQYTNPAFWRDDTRTLVRWLEQNSYPDDVVLLQTRHPFSWWMPHDQVPPLEATRLRVELAGLPAAVALIDTRPASTPADLATATAGKRRALWVTWKSSDTDPWALVPFVLGRASTVTADLPFAGYRVRVYDLDPAASLLTESLTAVGSRFGGGLELSAAAVSGPGGLPTAPADAIVYVTTRWTALAPISRELKYSVRLVDSEQRVVAQYDRLLWNDLRLQTDLWQPGQTTLAFAPVPLPPGTPPDRYQAIAVAYDPEQGQLPITAGPDPAFVGAIVLTPPREPARAGSLPMQSKTDFAADGLRLDGFTVAGAVPGDPPRLQPRPGDSIDVALAWSATTDRPAGTPRLVLTAADGRVVASQSLQPGGPSWPATGWAAGTAALERARLRLPAALETGAYRLAVSLGGADTSLARLEVTP